MAIWSQLEIILGPSGAYRRQLEGPLEIHLEQHQDKLLMLIFSGSEFFLGINLGQLGQLQSPSADPFGNKIKMSDAPWFLLDSESLSEPIETLWGLLGTLWSLPRGNLWAI